MVNKYITDMDDGHNFTNLDYTNELIHIKEQKIKKLNSLRSR